LYIVELNHFQLRRELTNTKGTNNCC